MSEDPVQDLADKIAAEQEWSKSTAEIRDEILRRFTQRLDELCERAPERLDQAIAVIVQAGPGRNILVLSDPSTNDLVKELTMYAEAGEASPLTCLLQAKIPL